MVCTPTSCSELQATDEMPVQDAVSRTVQVLQVRFELHGHVQLHLRTRLNRGQAIEASLQKIWKSHSIPISTKIRLMKVLVWPVVTYGCESWTLRKNEKHVWTPLR